MKQFNVNGPSGRVNENGKKFAKLSLKRCKRDETFQSYLDSIKERWKELGFTDGVEEDKLDILSLAYEQMAMILVLSSWPWWNESFEVDVFPMIRKIVLTIGEKFDIKKFIKLTKKTVEKAYETFDDLKFAEYDIDVEAHFVSIYADAIIENLNGNKVDVVDFIKNKLKKAIKENKTDEQPSSNNTTA